MDPSGPSVPDVRRGRPQLGVSRRRADSRPDAHPEADGTGELLLTGLPPGQEMHYRVIAQDVEGRADSEPLTGRFRTAAVDRRDVRFPWSGDVAGQGWGINPDIGACRSTRR
ncbi:hypothetical protein GCM10027174_09680 [Salinifilum aidingensis]